MDVGVVEPDPPLSVRVERRAVRPGDAVVAALDLRMRRGRTSALTTLAITGTTPSLGQSSAPLAPIRAMKIWSIGNARSSCHATTAPPAPSDAITGTY
jgi:hypothetical protein